MRQVLLGDAQELRAAESRGSGARRPLPAPPRPPPKGDAPGPTRPPPPSQPTRVWQLQSARVDCHRTQGVGKADPPSDRVDRPSEVTRQGCLRRGTTASAPARSLSWGVLRQGLRAASPASLPTSCHERPRSDRDSPTPPDTAACPLPAAPLKMGD